MYLVYFRLVYLSTVVLPKHMCLRAFVMRNGDSHVAVPSRSENRAYGWLLEAIL